MNLVIAHKNCMDGLASAYIMSEYFKSINESYRIEFMQYGDIPPITQPDTDVYFVDFSLPKQQLLDLSKNVKSIKIFDHHKTAQEALDGIELLASNISVVFDMNHSGAGICSDRFNTDYKLVNQFIVICIEDRDLWNWKIKDSKAIGAYLNFKVEKNSINSFEEAIKTDVESMIVIGNTLLEQQGKVVQEKIKNTRDITLLNHNIKAINTTENISEIGNAICLKYNTISLMYFITNDLKVVCSLRSIDALPSASGIATHFGGGGHRNACGFTIDIDKLKEILN